jgi:hypothetical protein
VFENMKGSKLHDLIKDHFALIHSQYFVLRNTKQISNRCSVENSVNVDILQKPDALTTFGRLDYN